MEPLSQQSSYPSTGNETDLNELDIPIALRKGTTSCTKHPISNFLGYSHLSKPLQAFVSRLSETNIPRDIQEAL